MNKLHTYLIHSGIIAKEINQPQNIVMYLHALAIH